MPNSTTNRNRWILPAPKPPLTIAADFFSRGDVWARIGLCALTTLILWIIMFGWEPPFAYRIRQSPVRDMHAHTSFEFKDLKATSDLKDRTRRNFLCFYSNDMQLLKQSRQALIDDVFEIKQKKYEDVQESKVWQRFFTPNEEGEPNAEATEEAYLKFQESLVLDEKLETLQDVLNRTFLEIDANGLLQNLEHEIGTGSMQEVDVYPKGGDLTSRQRVSISDVRIAEVSVDLRQRLIDEFSKETEMIKDGEIVAERIYQWIKPNLPVTLSFDQTNTNRAVEAEIKAIQDEMRIYEPGEKLEQIRHDREMQGIKAKFPFDVFDIELLHAEHDALILSEGLSVKGLRSLLFFGLFAAVFSMVCQYLYYRDRHLLDDLRHFTLLLGLILLTLTVSWVLALNLEWRAEIVPVMLFSITIAIAYHIELAIILSALVSLAFAVAHGYGMAEFVILTAASSSSALMCRRIRSRTKLVNVGLLVAAIIFPTVIGVNYLLGQPVGLPLLTDATWFAGGAGMAGLIMTALLPFLERWFDIHTDISLLELSDANHPLLRELVQRAPGTYNHSINVASISEAAAEAIGANGLLCRVGAYFHDIGKMRKPEYFIENQAGGANKHDDLLPTMSTLVIIAHVKDGSEIARTHRLPQRIIDLIEQHHGTTLVEYFFKRAEQQAEKEETENGSTIDEADYRYPGPRPQTPEAAVLMLADSVESASRTLREPAPSRIENLVYEMARKKLEDGQFDNCPITLEELKMIQDSLIKSLNAMYHARVKYPEQQQSA